MSPIAVSNAMKMMTAAEDTLKIIGTLLVIANIYCLVIAVIYYSLLKVVRYWHRRNNMYKKPQHHEALFKLPPQKEDCPICFLTLPSLITGSKYQTCCGKFICSGCIYAMRTLDGDAKCPFCRVATPESEEEIIERDKKRVGTDDANAIYNLGCSYYHGEDDVPQDRTKALELWSRAVELGNASANNNIGYAYCQGEGVERDMKKAQHYWELAAIGGNVRARYNLGCLEENTGKMRIALKHYMIVAGCGHDKSLKKIQEFYMNGHATKNDYATALRAHQKYIDGIKSDQRDEAAAFNECWRYH